MPTSPTIPLMFPTLFVCALAVAGFRLKVKPYFPFPSEPQCHLLHEALSKAPGQKGSLLPLFIYHSTQATVL